MPVSTFFCPMFSKNFLQGVQWCVQHMLTHPLSKYASKNVVGKFYVHLFFHIAYFRTCLHIQLY